MIINDQIIKNVEEYLRTPIGENLKRYLLVKYAEEPFPYVYSEQDLHINIRRDIESYECGELDITVKSPIARKEEEIEYLRRIYMDKCHEICLMEKKILELESILRKNNLTVPGETDEEIPF